MNEDMRDWPMTLKRNAAICELAKAIYRARGEAFGGETELTEQPTHIRSQYVTRADELLKTLEPARPYVVTGLRTPTSNVIGLIASEPGA